MSKNLNHGAVLLNDCHTLMWATLWMWHHKYFCQLKQAVQWAYSPPQYILEYITQYEAYLPLLHKQRSRYHYSYKEAICFLKEWDTALLWSIDYIVWQAGCIAWWIVSHYISSLGLSELLVPLHRAELHTDEHQTMANRHWIPNVEKNNVALFNYSNAVLTIRVCPFD